MASSFRFELKGDKEFISRLDRLPDAIERAVAAKLFQRAEAVMTISKSSFVPVDTGALRGSGHVSLPQIVGGRITVTLGYGGPAAPYAVHVHEDMSAHHPVGGAKYLERPMLAEVATLEAALGATIRGALGA